MSGSGSARTESSADLWQWHLWVHQRESSSLFLWSMWRKASFTVSLLPTNSELLSHQTEGQWSNIRPHHAELNKPWTSGVNIYLSFWKAAPFPYGWGWKARLISSPEWGSEEGGERWREGRCLSDSIHFLGCWCNLDAWVYFLPLSWRPVSLL